MYPLTNLTPVINHYNIRYCTAVTMGTAGRCALSRMATSPHGVHRNIGASETAAEESIMHNTFQTFVV